MIRIAHGIHGLDLGGAQQVVKHIVRETGARFEHVVYAPVGGVFEKELREVGATVRIVPRRVPKVDPVWIVRLAGALGADRPALLHTHLFGDSLHGYLASRLLGGIPVVMTLHNVAGFHSRLQRVGYRWLLRRVDRVVACSEAVRRSFEEGEGGSGSGIETVPNGVDEEQEAPDRLAARHALGVDDDAILLGGIGRLVEQKGFADLISALALVATDRQDVQLVLLGDGPLRESLRARAVQEGVGDRVRFAGFRSAVRALLAAFDVIVFSSLDEGLPMALLEAMAAGRCIIATNVGGVGEAIRDGREGVLVPPRNPSVLAAALRSVVGDPELRARLGEAARRRCLEEFTARRMADRYASIYTELLTATR